MHFVLLEVAQKVINLLGLRHEIRRTYQRLPAEIGWFGKMGYQILDVQDTTNIVNRALINRNTGVVILNNTLQHILIRSAEIQINNILTAGHHLFRCLVAKPNDAFQHILLLLQVILVCQFQCLFKVIDTEHMILFLNHLLCQQTRAQQDRG